jgi:hypothetical protein
MNSDFNRAYFDQRKFDIRRREKMHALDRKFIEKQVSKSLSLPISLLDIGCEDGSFSKPFLSYGWNVFGIEINSKIAKLANANGIKLLKSVELDKKFDIVIIRGTLHYLPDYETVLQSIKSNFIEFDGNTKWLFILAEPNAESFIYRRFNKLPSIEDDIYFRSNHKIHGANALRIHLRELGFTTVLKYPYIKTPYRKLPSDIKEFIILLFTKRYKPFPWFRNTFNLVGKYPSTEKSRQIT